MMVLTIAAIALVASAARATTVTSPDGRVQAHVTVSDEGRAVVSIQQASQTVLADSPLGITVEGTDLGQGSALQKTSNYTIDRHYAWRGRTSRAHNDCHGAKLHFVHNKSDQRWALDVRAYNTGVAWRYHVPGQGSRRVNGEATAFRLPEDATLWYQKNLVAYEGNYRSLTLDDGWPDKGPDFMGPPVTAVFEGEGPDAGAESYLLLTGSASLSYSGMALKPTGRRALAVTFHDDPKGWSMDGAITSSWRVAIVASNLNDLANSQVVNHVASRPDSELFPQGANTDWIQPGRSLWPWYHYGRPGAQWNEQKDFVDKAAKLNSQYLLVDAGWEMDKFGWRAGDRDNWDRLAELCAYAEKQGVGIWVWTSVHENQKGYGSPGLETPAKRRRFFRKADEAGVVGVKIDYFNNESHEKLAMYEGCLREAAEHQIMVNFHGSNAPGGEARTWPHEMTREGVRGMEHHKWGRSDRSHWTVLPFTRLVAGHGDVTPGVFHSNRLKNTTRGLQLAGAVIYTSPLLCWADTYEVYCDSAATDLIQNMPVTWDETRVLAGSALGQRVLMARRKGETWWVAGINGQNEADQPAVPLDFLASGQYAVTLLSDGADTPADELRIERYDKSSRNLSQLKPWMAPGGGFVARLKPVK
jgi:alpha-glucosidase